MTIATLLSQGNAIQLGPVTVEKTYDRKPGDKNRFLLISDSSGKGALKIWGAAANTELFPNQQITLIGFGPKGGLKTSEYNGKVSIDANDCRIEIGGAIPASQAAPQASTEHVGYNEPRQQTQAVYTSPSVDRVAAVAKQAARGTALYIEDLIVNHGFTKDEAIMLAQGAHNMYPVYWGGEKFLG